MEEKTFKKTNYGLETGIDQKAMLKLSSRSLIPFIWFAFLQSVKMSNPMKNEMECCSRL